MLCRCSSGVGPALRCGAVRRGLCASARPSQARVAVRMARITLELGIIQLRKMRNVDVAIRSVKMREAFIRCAFARAFSRAFRARSRRRKKREFGIASPTKAG